MAYVLGVDPEELPSQYDAYSQAEGDDGRWSLRYHNPIGAYLKKHHGLAYVEVNGPQELLDRLRPSGLHLISGRTARSDVQDGARHMVVGREGKLEWDPHPSRDGLLDDGTGHLRWAFLVRFPSEWEAARRDETCVCPKCKAVP